MIVNVELSSICGAMLNISRLVRSEDIIGSKVFSRSRFNNTFDNFRYERKIGNRTIVRELVCDNSETVRDRMSVTINH